MTATVEIPRDDDPEAVHCNQALALRHLDLVHETARYYSQRLRGVIPSEDLFGAGLLGLMKACTRRPECKETEFRFYARVCIRGAIQDELRKLDTMPRGSRKKMISTAVDSPEAAKLQSLFAQRAQFFSLEGMQTRPNSSHQEADWTLLDCLSDDAQPPGWRILTDKEELAQLCRALNCLNTEEKQIIHWYYFENLSLREIGYRLGVSASYVCQYKNRILERLRGWYCDLYQVA